MCIYTTLGSVFVPVSDIALVYLTDSVRLLLFLMGVAGSIFACLKIALGALSLGTETCSHFIELLKVLIKAAFLLAVIIFMIPVMDGQVNIHIDGVRFSPLKIVREKLPLIFGFKPFTTQREPPPPPPPSAPIHTPPDPPSPSSTGNHQHYSSQPTTPGEERSLTTVIRAIFDYFIPPTPPPSPVRAPPPTSG